MAGIHVYNIKKETHSGDGVFYCGRKKGDDGSNISPIANPYTHIKDKDTLASYVVKDRDTAVEMYDHYFDVMYGSNLRFTKAIDKIYSRYRSGVDVYLGCFCHPEKCHCDIIKKKLEQRLIKEKFQELKKKNT